MVNNRLLCSLCKICSIDKVYREMTGGGHEDYVSDWAKQNKAIFQKTTSKRVQDEVRHMGGIIRSIGYNEQVVKKFFTTMASSVFSDFRPKTGPELPLHQTFLVLKNPAFCRAGT